MHCRHNFPVVLIVVLFMESCVGGVPQKENEIGVLATAYYSAIPEPIVLPADKAYSAFEVGIPTSMPVLKKVVDVSSLPPEFWMDLPVIPESISDNTRLIYERGLSMGNNPSSFSKVGDCHSTNPYFLADYDLGLGAYQLGEYADLQVTINYFKGSFGRPSLAAKQGLSTAGVLAPLWSDWKLCNSNETPLDCEFRLNHPSFALISLGTNEAHDVKLDKTPFEGRLRRIIEHSIDQGVVPILSTKADNDEGDHYINFVTAKLAMEYELPLWNFWRAVQPLPQHGMRSADHLTFAPTKSFTDFSKAEYLEYGMQMRNLTALQVMDMIRREITQPRFAVTSMPMVTPTPAAQIVHQSGVMMVSPIDGMILLYVPSGEFEMGMSSGKPDELPVHIVSLAGYWIDKTEITNAMYAKFLNEAGNRVEGGVAWLDTNDPLVWVTNRSDVWQSVNDKGEYPIVGVSWYGASAYCEWVGRSLPTEAQWEYAAKGTDGFRFPWGERGPECTDTRFLGCGNRPVEVNSLPLGASPFGVLGMAGNVAEWVNDRYAADYYQQSPVVNPVGPANGYYRVLRGGSWNSTYISLQTSHREWAGADIQDGDIGFRCVLNP